VIDRTLATPTSTPSPSPPLHFSIRAVIDSNLARKIYAENQAHRSRAYCDIDAMLGLPNHAVLTSDTHLFDPYSLGMASNETVMYTHVQEANQKRQKLIHKAVRLERRLREVLFTDCDL
jgi:hypothetical protein